jgi:transketolase
VLLGDGEVQEGQVWEAAMYAAQMKLDNLVAFLDCNRCQVDGFVHDICSIEPVADKWRSFGWQVQRIDGHDLGQILTALGISNHAESGPHMIVADTVKGKGISYMENQPEWHARAIDDEEYHIAVAELDAAETSLVNGGAAQ